MKGCKQAVRENKEIFMKQNSFRMPSSQTTFWVPSWKSPCGIAEYTDCIAEVLPSVKVIAHPSNIKNTHLLHIQHEYGIFKGFDISHYIQLAHQHNIPVIITQHTIRPIISDWQHDADILVALGEGGSEMLHDQWPDKTVVHIPHGCPTWFPTRKVRRSRVIGAFGFMNSQKGFFKLLEVLKGIPEAELLIFSYPKAPELEYIWSKAVEDLPVQRVSEFLSVREIAQQLAAEADILVCWYDDILPETESGAVRIGLSTGVPVLASPTKWFRSVRNVTYQPENLVEGIHCLLDDSSLRMQLTTAAKEYCHANSWSEVAKLHADLWRAL
jgi:glycosyltransferase involved in cell wall biosynthesis